MNDFNNLEPVRNGAGGPLIGDASEPKRGRPRHSYIIQDGRALELSRVLLESSDYGSPAYDLACWAMWRAFSSGHREVLKQIMQEPVWDGNIISKAHRDDLIKLGLAVRVCVKMEQGYTAATSLAYSVFSRCPESPV